MNIKIKHFQKKTSYSNKGKNKLLATLGLMASLGVVGCDNIAATAGNPALPEIQESSSSESDIKAGIIEMPESSSSAEIKISAITDTEPLAGSIIYRDDSSSSMSSSSSEEAPEAGVIQMPESSSSIDAPLAGIPVTPTIIVEIENRPLSGEPLVY